VLRPAPLGICLARVGHLFPPEFLWNSFDELLLRYQQPLPAEKLRGFVLDNYSLERQARLTRSMLLEGKVIGFSGHSWGSISFSAKRGGLIPRSLLRLDFNTPATYNREQAVRNRALGESALPQSAGLWQNFRNTP
jgi:hypothetical protein